MNETLHQYVYNVKPQCKMRQQAPLNCGIHYPVQKHNKTVAQNTCLSQHGLNTIAELEIVASRVNE